MFNEYDFLEYCEEQYLNGLCQEDAWEEQRRGTVSENVRTHSTWQLVCWLGEYTQKQKNKEIA